MTGARRLVIGVALAAAMGGCRETQRVEHPLTPVRAQTAEMAPAANALRYSATIQPVAQINLAFKVGGYVAEILQVPGVGGEPRNLHEGDRVARGTVLARLQQADYQVQVNNARSQLREAEAGRVQAAAQLRDAEASQPQAVAQLASAQAALDKAQRDFTRAKNLYDTQSLTRADYDAAKAALDSAQASTDGARAGVESADAKIANARAQLDAAVAKVESARQQLAAQEIPLGDTSLRAPTDAVVLSRKIEVGTFAQPGMVGFTVASLGTVKAVFSVPDNVVRGLSLGRVLPVTAELPGPDVERRGPITSIAPSADPQSRVFQVEVTLPNPRGDLRLGMIVTVAVGDQGAPAPYPAVPLSAVVRPGGGSTGYAVFVLEDQAGKPIARRRPVVLGDVLGNRIVVREGVRLGERVVVSGATLLADGQPVKSMPVP